MNKEEVVKGLKWILEGDRFGFDVNWAEDCETTPRDDEEQAGYNIQRAIEYIEWLYDQNEYVNLVADEFIKEWKKNPEVIRCKDCKYRSLYCTEATDGTTLYTCHHPCANDVPRPFDWFCADGERRMKWK